MGRCKAYTEEQELQFRQALIECGGVVADAARKCGVAYAVMHRRAELLRGVSEPIRAKHDALWAEVSEQCAERVREMVPQMPATPEGLTAVVGASKVAVNAHLDYRDGRKLQTGATVNVDNRSITIEYVSDWRG